MHCCFYSNFNCFFFNYRYKSGRTFSSFEKEKLIEKIVLLLTNERFVSNRRETPIIETRVNARHGQLGATASNEQSSATANDEQPSVSGVRVLRNLTVNANKSNDDDDVESIASDYDSIDDPLDPDYNRKSETGTWNSKWILPTTISKTC